MIVDTTVSPIANRMECHIVLDQAAERKQKKQRDWTIPVSHWETSETQLRRFFAKKRTERAEAKKAAKIKRKSPEERAGAELLAKIVQQNFNYSLKEIADMPLKDVLMYARIALVK